MRNQSVNSLVLGPASMIGHPRLRFRWATSVATTQGWQHVAAKQKEMLKTSFQFLQAYETLVEVVVPRTVLLARMCRCCVDQGGFLVVVCHQGPR
jgi:hypothetical protein